MVTTDSTHSKRCVKGATQNLNEFLHSKVWNKCHNKKKTKEKDQKYQAGDF